MALKGEGDLTITFQREKKMPQCLNGEEESQLYQAALIIHSKMLQRPGTKGKRTQHFQLLREERDKEA